MGLQPDGSIALEGALELQSLLLVVPSADGSGRLDPDNQLLGSDCVLARDSMVVRNLRNRFVPLVGVESRQLVGVDRHLAFLRGRWLDQNRFSGSRANVFFRRSRSLDAEQVLLDVGLLGEGVGFWNPTAATKYETLVLV